MRHSLALCTIALLLAFSCSSSRNLEPARNQSGAIAINIIPNPIIATHVSGNTYDFAFVASIREINGVNVNVDRISVDVTALGAISVYKESMDAEQIAAMGYPRAIGAGGELRYDFHQRKNVPDERLFGNVRALLTVDGTDAKGNHVSAQTTVTVRR